MNRRRLVLVVYAIGVGAGLMAAVVFTSTLSGRVNVPYVSAIAFSTLVFWGSVAVWVVFTLQDSVLISVRRDGLVPWGEPGIRDA